MVSVMPYRRIGNMIYTKSSGHWRLKQACRDVENAKKAMRLLQGLEHGSINPNNIRRKKKRRKRK